MRRRPAPRSWSAIWSLAAARARRRCGAGARRRVRRAPPRGRAPRACRTAAQAATVQRPARLPPALRAAGAAARSRPTPPLRRALRHAWAASMPPTSRASEVRRRRSPRSAPGRDAAAAQHDAQAAVLGGKVYVFGGGYATELDHILSYDPATGAVSQVGALSAPQSDVARDPGGGAAYIVGGFDGTNYLNTVVELAPGLRARRRRPSAGRPALRRGGGGRQRAADHRRINPVRGQQRHLPPRPDHPPGAADRDAVVIRSPTATPPRWDRPSISSAAAGTSSTPRRVTSGPSIRSPAA